MRQADRQHENDAGGEASGGDGVRMEVREPGARYQIAALQQRTDVGILPADWCVARLFDIATVTSGKRLPLGRSLTTSETPHPYIRVSDMRRGTVDATAIQYVPEDVFPTIQQYRIYSTDLYISVAGTLGLVGGVPSALDGANLTENANRISGIRGSKPYLYQVLASPLVQSVIESERTVGAQPKLALGRIRNFSIPLPPTSEEQVVIGDALTDADTLIDSLEQLLTKKRQIKQGAMQELLSGKRRLPGFSQPWRNVGLDQLGSFLKGAGIRRDEASSGDLPCVRYGEIYTVHSDSIRTFQSWISPAVASTATKLQRGDLLFAGSGETKEEIGKCVAVLDDFVAFAGGDIVILRPNSEVNAMFMGYLLNTPVVVRQKASRGQGDAVVHISAAALGQVSVDLPEPSEQTAIAQVLSDMDTDLTALESRLTKARALKQAMAQALLTGRIRLTEGAAA